MRKPRVIIILALTCALAIASLKVGHADPNKHDISSAGQPTITGNIGGFVIGTPNLLSDLNVVVNFGELTPINANSIVKVVVPVAIRSTNEFQITMSVAGSFGTNANAVNASDIGLGIQNFRSLGARATACGADSVINPAFLNDPALSVTVNPSTGRAQYPTSLASIGPSTVLINGPILSIFRGVGNWRRETNNGRAFDLILAIKPQWFEPGDFSITLTLSMSSGPIFPCND